jgi:hypothetical protein
MMVHSTIAYIEAGYSRLLWISSMKIDSRINSSGVGSNALYQFQVNEVIRADKSTLCINNKGPFFNSIGPLYFCVKSAHYFCMRLTANTPPIENSINDNIEGSETG